MGNRFTSYVDGVLSGDIIVPRTISDLVIRHVMDLENEESDFYFDEVQGYLIVEFAELLTLYEEPFRGTPLKLEPWQVFFFVLLMGWRRKDNGTRRFRKVYFQIARKNAKTTMGAVLALYFLRYEGSAEIYAIATKTDQSKITYKKMSGLLDMTPGLKKGFRVLRGEILRGNSCFKYMSSESKMSDGFNPSFTIVDEYHAHPSDELVQVYQSGMGARLEPLVYIVTTAGFDTGSACHEEFQRAKKVLDGTYQDDSFLPVIYELDEGDDWKNPEVWGKSNPNLGVSVFKQYLRDQFNEALQKPSKEVDFKVKNLNLWDSGGKVKWISREVWERNTDGELNEEDLRGRTCYAGIDLSAVSDLTTYALTFPPIAEGEPWKVLHRVYIPEDSIAEKAKHEHVMYRKWIQDGYVSPTPGDVVDHSYLIADFLRDSEEFDIREVGYDPALSGSIVSQLEGEGIELVKVGQGLMNFSPITKDWETEVRRGTFIDTNPVMAWCLGNAKVKPDTNDNYKPLKPSKHQKIDTVITSIMAHSRAVANASEDKPKSSDLNRWAELIALRKAEEEEAETPGDSNEGITTIKEDEPRKKISTNPLNRWAETYFQRG